MLGNIGILDICFLFIELKVDLHKHISRNDRPLANVIWFQIYIIAIQLQHYLLH